MYEDAAEFYRENGYYLAKGLFPIGMIEEMRQEADAMVERALEAQRASFLWEGQWMDREEKAKLALHGVHDPQFHAAVFGRALFHAPMLNLLEALIGPNLELHHSKLIVKPPQKGAPFPMHQDYPYFPHENHTMLAVSLHMDAATEENGCLRVVPGSHKMGPIPVEADGYYFSPERFPLEESTPAPAEPGDALIFNYLTVHGSGPNTSDRPRRNVLFQIRAADDPPTEDTHHSRGQGMILKGIKPTFRATDL